MPDKTSKPVVLLIYANTGSALDCLKPETDTIAVNLKDSGLCDVRIVPAATLSDVVTAINDPVLQDRVAIVHYAGHANGRGIQLQSTHATTQGETAYMRGLAEVLKQQPHLRLLFINGCASREQVLELTQAGIPLVIATNRGIDDQAARDFAECFYRTLGQQRSIIEAFQVAEGSLQSGAGTNVRGVYFGEFQKSAAAQDNEWPWELHGPDADRRWSLRDPYYRGTGPRWDHTKFAFNPESPYLGLRYFAEEDSTRFFGRDDFVKTLLTASESAPLLLVIGASGTGKSSVVRAGMIPHWKKKHRGASRGRAFVFTPQDDPFEQLSTTLATVDTFDRKQIRSVREARSRTALRDAVKTFGQGEPWLFFVDQFEQIFTRTTDQKKRADFLEAITDLAKSEHPNVCLVLAMRDDFFPQFRDYPELFPVTDKYCFRVAALSREALQEVIERPAAENGVTFQPGLVATIIDAVDRQPGALPLLQYVLDALWKADDPSDRLLNETTYTDLGGVTGSLGRRLQDLYDLQDHSGKDEFRWMMLKLVTYDESATGSTVVSRLAPKSEFGGKQADLLDQLIAQGLVVSSGTSTTSVQLGHEKIIAAWPEFTKWTQEYREANTVRQQLSRTASEWAELLALNEKQKTTRALWQGSQLEKALELRQRGDFDQLGGLDSNDNRFLDASHSHSQRMIRGLQWAVGIALVLMVIAAGLASFGWWSYDRAETANISLDKTNKELDKTNKELVKSVKETKRQLAKASWQAGLRSRDYGQHPLLAAHQFLQAADIFTELGDRQEADEALVAESLIQPSRTFLHDDRVSDVLVAPRSGRLLTLSDDGAARLRDSKDGTRMFEFRHASNLPDPYPSYVPIVSASFSGDESRLLTHSHYGSLRVWDLTSSPPRLVASHDESSGLDHARFSVTGTCVLMLDDHKPALWNLSATGDHQLMYFPEAANRTAGIEFIADGLEVVTWNSESATAWDISTPNTVVRGREFPHEKLTGVKSDQRGTRLLTWGDDGTARLWDVLTDKPPATFKHGEGERIDTGIRRAMFSPDESRILTDSHDKVCIWDADRPDQLRATLRHPVEASPVNVGQFGRLDGAWVEDSHVLTWGEDGTVRVWLIWKDEAPYVQEIIRPYASFSARSSATEIKFEAIVSPNRQYVATWSGSAAQVWLLSTGERIDVCRHEGKINGLAFQGEGPDLITWSSDGAVRIWDFTTVDAVSSPWPPVTVQTRIRGPGWISTAEVPVSSLDGYRFLLRDKAEPALWDIRQPKVLSRFTINGESWNGALLTRDGRRLLVWSKGNGTAQLVDVADGQVRSEFPHGAEIAGAAFSDDEQLVVLWSQGDSTFSVWSCSKVDDGPVKEHFRRKHTVEAHRLGIAAGDGPLEAARFSPNGTSLMTYGNDLALIWDVQQPGNLKLQNSSVKLQSWSQPLFASDWSFAVQFASVVGLVTLPHVTDVKGFESSKKGGKLLGSRQGAISPDNSRVGISIEGSHEVLIWDQPKKMYIATFKHDDNINGLCFSNDSSRVLTWSNDGTAKIWDIAAQRPVATFLHEDSVKGAIFAKDERHAITWTTSQICIWSVAEQGVILCFNASYPDGVRLTDDEKQLLTWSGEEVTVHDLVVDPVVPISQMKLELEVDTGSVLDENGKLRIMKYEEWSGAQKSLSAQDDLGTPSIER